MKIFESKNKIIEFGFSDQIVDGHWFAFQAKEYRAWKFYFRIIKPTLDCLKRTNNNKSK